MRQRQVPCCLLPLLLASPAALAAGALHDEPPMERVVRVVESQGGTDVALAALVSELAKAEVVFLGETHIDETTHRFEAWVYEQLIERREGHVVLALEMFSRDAQPALDAYLAGSIDEATFLSRADAWANYRTAYRRLVELAKARGLPVVGSNVPAALKRKVAMGGEEAWRGLAPEERALAPAELHDNTDPYWERVGNAMRSHRHFLPSGAERVYSTQSLWDNSMGESCARALEAHPGWLVLHVNGGFHSSRHDGTVRQLLLRRPGTRVKTVDIAPADDPTALDAGREPAVADYLAFSAARARDVDDGRHGVRVGRDFRYRLHVPEWASAERRAPLLLWLPDDRLPPAEVFGFWRAQLGDEAAIAVFEPPHRERQEDLSLGGLWWWPDELDEELGGIVAGVDEAWGYLVRNLPIDAERVALAGDGTGASAAVACALRGDRWQGTALALSPRRYVELRELPLPLAEDRAQPEARRALRVLAAEADQAWWSEELAQYAAVGIEAKLEKSASDPWQREAELGAAVRQALGLATAPAAPEAPSRCHLRLEAESPLARLWGRRLALGRTQAKRAPVAVLGSAELTALGEAGLAGSRELTAPVTAGLFADGKALPRAPGPFGGTTLVVLPSELPVGERDAWRAFEADDPLAKASRFHRLRVADIGAGPAGIAAVLAALEESGRRNVLIVPAAFAASGELMAAIRAAARPREESMTLHYLPGLGGAVAEAEERERRPPAPAQAP